MIQVCSQCGTRWNVRDRQRVWCPRCHGTLLAPSQPASQWAPQPGSTQPAQRSPSPLLPPGYRWVAVRPGAPPPPRARRRILGPTPRYQTIPRWGLVEQFDAPAQQQVVRGGPSAAAVRTALVATAAALGTAAFVHLVRYVLLIVNRSTLLNKWIAAAATWGGVAVSVVAVFMVVASAVLLTNWLIARRATAYAHYGQQEPWSAGALRAGCLIPVLNLAWAPVFVIELAGVEARLKWLRRSIVVWWLVWVAATLVSGFSIATSFATDAQGIADNTVTTIVAYLFGIAATLLALQVFLGFERQPVERPARRWVMVAADGPPTDGGADQDTNRADGRAEKRDGDPSADQDGGHHSARAVEREGQDPAA